MDGAIRLMRWMTPDSQVHLGLAAAPGSAVVPIDPKFASWEAVWRYCQNNGDSMVTWARNWVATHMPIDVEPEMWILPLEVTELWAAGATYERGRNACEAETTGAQDMYNRVREVDRPELFWKGLGSHVAGPFQPIGLRHDATWHVPEPELTAVLDGQGAVWGYTIGNDVTARDLAAENRLYLPQAKLFYHSAAIGPAVVLAETLDPYRLTITLEIWRHNRCIWQGESNTDRLKRRIDELVSWLGRARPLAPWAGLMTGSDLILADELGLEDGDEVRVEIPPIGVLVNRARRIDPRWVGVAEPPRRVVRLDPRDTVAVALGALEAGHWLSDYGVAVREAIPFGHKVALRAMAMGESVVKYGESIGVASQDITPGEHVHAHNIESARGRGDLVGAERIGDA